LQRKDDKCAKKSSTIASIDKNETSIPTMPAKEEEITSFDWPKIEEDEELELENQMIQLQIRLEREKEERMEKRDRRREEDDRKFMREVTRIEEREERLQRCKEAKKKDDQEWLEIALLSEDAHETSVLISSPEDPPPTLQAAKPVGAEPWWKERMMMTDQGCLEETGKSNPASTISPKDIPAKPAGHVGANTSKKEQGDATHSAPTTALGLDKMTDQGCLEESGKSNPASTIPSKDIPAKPAGHVSASTSQKEQGDATYSAPTTPMGLEKMKEKTKQPDKVADSISKKRLKMKTSRSQNRSLILSKTRDLPSTVDEPDQPPAANPKVSMLVSMLETSTSPVKMPRTPPASTAMCRTDSSSLLFKCHLPSQAPNQSKPKARPVEYDRM
jgi:hypothetical protein